ncbi:uncharacterized protein UTRI_04038 [Ustilago trichophora]|uniref:Fms interacting protein n=1 Tax=Ustilago trichophora TaxID=86804 RepID=A0A5C3EB98_9BASI|nr:uncharacterized protein UTRI_04038 [Ustilago trichophora]
MASVEEELKQALEALSHISDLKEASEDISQPNNAAALQLLTASTPHFSTLKRVNRRIYNDLQSQKTLVAEERAKVDSARLALQNLKYEESMLELEVKMCQEFQSIYQDIQLHSLQEFHQLRTQSSSSTISAQTGENESMMGEDAKEEDLEDDHKLMLARLRFELKERKRLEAEKQRLQQDKMEVTKENREKKVKLEQAERLLKELLAGAQALQAKFESF